MLTGLLRSLSRDALTTLLDVIGLGLIVAGFAIAFGLVAGLLSSGVAVLIVSVALAWSGRRR